jgi:hypothetical protein
MNLDEALAYDAGPSGDLACEHWCDAVSLEHLRPCNCGMERARAAIATLQAEVAWKEQPMT